MKRQSRINVKKWIKTFFVVLLMGVRPSQVSAINVCSDNGYVYYSAECRYAELILEAEAALGYRFNHSFDLQGRVGVGYQPIGLTVGPTFNLSLGPNIHLTGTPQLPFSEPQYKEYTQNDIGVYLKYAGFPLIPLVFVHPFDTLGFELSGHYLFSASRHLREPDVDGEGEVESIFNGYGIGFGAGVSLGAVATLRTEITYYEFFEMISDGETIEFNDETYHLNAPENGVQVSLLVTFPLRFMIDTN